MDGELQRVVEAIVDKTGLMQALRAEGTVEAEGRLENIQEFLGVAAEFEETHDISRARSRVWRSSAPPGWPTCRLLTHRWGRGQTMHSRRARLLMPKFPLRRARWMLR